MGKSKMTPEQKDLVLEFLRRAEIDMQVKPVFGNFSASGGKQVLSWLRHYVKEMRP
jgi:hypothetical protein